MRRLLAFLFIIGIALASSNEDNSRHNRHKHSNDARSSEQPENFKRPIDYVPEYRQQKEYIYQYDTQISTGLNDQRQYAVQRMRAQLRLTFTNDKTATAQLQQWQASRLNDDVRHPINKMMSIESLRSVEIPRRHLQLLEKPFEISYEKGNITEIIFDSQDKIWSENIKRAAVNAFQLRMDVDERDSMTYHANETTIEGECESMYTILPEIKCNSVKSTETRYLEAKDKGQCVQVTKSINFDACRTRPDLRYNHYRGEQVDMASRMEHREQRALEQSTISQVELKKADEGKYVLRFSRTISQQTLHLTENTAMMAVSIGELQLKAIKKPTQNADEVKNRKSPSNLMHSLEFDEMLENFAVDGKEDYLTYQDYLTERNIPDVLVNIAKRLSQSYVGNAQNNWSMDSDSAAHQFTNFVKILRHATKDDLDKTEERLFQKDDEIPSAQQKSVIERLYIDALALAATQHTTRRLLEKIDGKQLGENHSAAALQKLARNIPIVGDKLMHTLWKLCQKVKSGSNLQHACVLSYAQMANTRCGRNNKLETGKKIGDLWTHDKKSEERCSDSIKNTYTKNIHELYSSSSDDIEQRILALKAYGNMGIDTSIHHIEQIINDRGLSRLDRVTAIDALRQMTTQIPHKIRRILMSVYMNKREFPEIRMNAIHLILRAQPDKPTISQITMETLRESNSNIRKFVMSELHSLSLKMRNINPKSAQLFADALQMFKRISADEIEQMLRSGSLFTTVQTDDNHLVSFAALFSNDSFLPTEMMMQMDVAFREHFVPVYQQFGIHQQEIEELVKKLYERVGSQQINEILTRGKRSTFSDLYNDPVQTMKKMLNKLRIVSRRNSQAGSSLMFYHREKNMDTWFVLIDEKHMPERLKNLLTDGELDVSALETQGNKQISSISANFLFETKVKVPTIFGVPIVSTVRLTKVSALHGSVSTDLHGSGKYITGGRVSIKTVPKVSMKMTQSLKAFSPLFSAGVQLQHSLDAQIPIEMEIEAGSSPRGILTIDFKLPEQEDRAYKLLHITSHPSTLYREWPQKSRAYIEQEEKTVFLPQLRDSFVKFDKEMHCPLSQIKVELRGHYHFGGSDNGLYVGENVMEVHAHVSEKTAKIIRIQLDMDRKEVSGQSLEIQRVMHVFDEKRNALFKGNIKHNEIQLLKEYLQRINAHPSFLYEFDAKLMALGSKEDQIPREQIELLTKAMCDKEIKYCSKEIHFQMKGRQLTGSVNDEISAHIMATIARPTISGLYGSIRSEHVLAHVECEFDKKNSKNVVTFCVYGRPSLAQIQQWNEIKNMQSAKRESDSEKFESMEDGEYDQMVIQQLPSRLSAQHFSVLTEYQLSQNMTQKVNNHIQYTILKSKSKSQVVSWIFSDHESARAHGQLKADVIHDNGYLTYEIEDVQKCHRVPSWYRPYFMSEQHNHRISSFKHNESNSNENSDEDSLPNRQRFGQRQTNRRFGSGSTNAKCIIDKNFHVKSFDGKEYKIPMSTCYTVLAKDCGSHSSPKFSVLAKKQSESNSALKIKMLVPGKQFELYQPRNGKMIITLKGVELSEEKYEENGIHKITETRRPTFVLHCSVTGMELRFDGRTVMLSISQEYINRQCGVCGHYNLDHEDTFRRENNQLASNMKEFHSSYLYRGDKDEEDYQCSPKAEEDFNKLSENDYVKKSSNSEESSEELFENMEEKNKNMHNQGNSENQGKKQQNNSDESTESKRPSKKISLVPMTVLREQQDVICFSVKPQKSCPKGYYPIFDSDNSDEISRETEVDFVCKPRNNKSAIEWRKQIRRGTKVIEELKDTESNQRLPVKQVKRCSAQRKMSADY